MALAIVAPAHAANLLTNGSFEDITKFVPNGQNTDVLGVGSTDMPGWAVTTLDIAWIGPSNPFGLSASPNPGGGSYFLDLTSYHDGQYGGVTQTITTVAGAKYLLSFDLGSDGFGVQSGVLASAGSTSALFLSTNPGAQANRWETATLNFTATGSSTVISFLGNAGARYAGLDNVSVALLTTPSVPEPATWGMMLLGFGLVGSTLRRRAENRRLSVIV